MKKIILLAAAPLVLCLTACGGTEQNEQAKRWSKPYPVFEGCNGVLSNSKQCQKNPNTQQFMIQIDRN